MTRPVVLFVFGGRRANLNLAVPYYRALLDAHPGLEIHLWDLARDPSDSRFMRALPTSDRFRVRCELYGHPDGQNEVWRHYTSPRYNGVLFVKADDDDVFWDVDRFGGFVANIAPRSVLSAAVVNNGASTALFPDVDLQFSRLGIPLLDVHRSVEYADLSHRWFHDNWRPVLAAPPRPPVPAASWCSINAIGYDWHMGQRIAARLGHRSPVRVFDRLFRPGSVIGDEGAVNLLPQRIDPGFTVAHLTFGPQERRAAPGLVSEWRKLYADISRQYLGEGR